MEQHQFLTLDKFTEVKPLSRKRNSKTIRQKATRHLYVRALPTNKKKSITSRTSSETPDTEI